MATQTTYIIYNTAGNPITAIQPNTLNGPSGVQQSSDLRMYGQGFAAWGEGVNENDYHLVENFACPESVLNPGFPMGETELGQDNGINAPLVGQLWFNTTAQELFVYTAALTWEAIAGTTVYTGAMPGSPFLGQLWWDASGLGQLKIYNGSSFVSVAAQYLPLTGGTLTGPLAMSGQPITNLANPTASQDAATKQYVDTMTGGGPFLPLVGGTLTGTLTMNVGGTAIDVTGAGAVNISGGGTLNISGGSADAINVNNRKITGLPLPVSGTDATSRNFTEATYLKLIGGNVTGVIDMGNNKITTVATPTASQDAANKQYVDDTTANSSVVASIGTATYNLPDYHYTGVSGVYTNVGGVTPVQVSAYSSTAATHQCVINASMVFARDGGDDDNLGLRLFRSDGAIIDGPYDVEAMSGFRMWNFMFIDSAFPTNTTLTYTLQQIKIGGDGSPYWRLVTMVATVFKV